MATKENKEAAIREALKSCLDPELGLDVVNLGLIYGISLWPKKVVVTMTLTTPGCPLVPYFQQQLETAVKSVAGDVEVVIDLTFDPPWSPDRMSPEAKLQLGMIRPQPASPAS